MRFMVLLALCVVTLTTACTSLTVQKVDPYGQGDGFRYSLPRPFVIATPMADGTVEYRVEMLPDESRTYAIRSEAILSSQDLLVKLNRGLLTELKWLDDSSAVASQLATSAGEVETAKTKAETEASKAAAAKTEELDGEISKAALELSQAEAELKLLEGPPAEGTDAQRLAAKVALKKAEAKLNALRARRHPDSSVVGTGASLNSITEGDGIQSAFGPVIFRVVETLDRDGEPKGLTLEAVEDQRIFDSFVKPKPPQTPNTPGAPTIEVDAPSLKRLEHVPSAGAKVQVRLKQDIKGIVGTVTMAEVDTGTPADNAPTAKRLDSKTIELTFLPGTKPANYELQIRVKTDSYESVPFKVPVTVDP